VNSSEGAAFVEAARRFFDLGDSAGPNVNGSASSESGRCHPSQEGIQDAEEVTPKISSEMPRH
jgi:hypothetical protein